MLELLWLIPTLPLVGFLILAFAGPRLPRPASALVGVLSVVFSAFVTLVVAAAFVSLPPENRVYAQVLRTWMEIGPFKPEIALYMDPLSLIMLVVVTVVGSLIHIYSVEYMIDDDGYSRFFAYMNLFVSSMVILVLADNLLVLYVGWEGVGLCSYLLIGFWYREDVNAQAAMKAFIVTRIGDTAMAVGLFLLFTTFGTLNIQAVMKAAGSADSATAAAVTLAALLLLGGAVGKSAQLPLQTWLPDAMAGPTPVSALIHAATMVTAGVYLIARTHVLFSVGEWIQPVVAGIGLATLLLAGFSALTQSDIKRVLAYSTMSQIGYMFLALGVGAWSAAMFHFFTHAFFKALLFLAAGSIIVSLHHEQNMFKMGGLRTQLPVTFWTFLIGAASLSSLPLVTSGFYSKDAILWGVWTSARGGWWLTAGALLGAVLTSLYTFRMVFLTFFGEPRQTVTRKPGGFLHIPMLVLAFGAVAVGFLETPLTLGDVRLFSTFLGTALPSHETVYREAGELIFQLICITASVAGVYIAYRLYLRGRQRVEHPTDPPAWAALHRFWFVGWSFDLLYDTLFVKPFLWIARLNRRDVVDLLSIASAWVMEACHEVLSLLQTGRLRHYTLGVALGAVAAIAIMVFL